MPSGARHDLQGVVVVGAGWLACAALMLYVDPGSRSCSSTRMSPGKPLRSGTQAALGLRPRRPWACRVCLKTCPECLWTRGTPSSSGGDTCRVPYRGC